MTQPRHDIVTAAIPFPTQLLRAMLCLSNPTTHMLHILQWDEANRLSVMQIVHIRGILLRSRDLIELFVAISDNIIGISIITITVAPLDINGV